MREKTLKELIDAIITHSYGHMSDEKFEEELAGANPEDSVTVGEVAEAMLKMLTGLAQTIETVTEVQEERYRVLVESLPEEYQENIKLKLKENQDDILDILDEGEDE